MLTRKKQLYQDLASLVQARLNCIEHGNDEWKERHEEAIEELVREYMPHGSGFDSGTTIDLEKSTGDKLIFYTSFHHMDENGCYCGWSGHTITVKPAFNGIDLKVTKGYAEKLNWGSFDYIHETIHYSLTQEVEREVE